MTKGMGTKIDASQKYNLDIWLSFDDPLKKISIHQFFLKIWKTYCDTPAR